MKLSEVGEGFMLDKITSAVLEIVNAGTEGSYKVMETADFLALLPAKRKTDEQGLANALKFLGERGYIDVKYSDNGTYCLCSLPKGRMYAENTAATSFSLLPRIPSVSPHAAAITSGVTAALFNCIMSSYREGASAGDDSPFSFPPLCRGNGMAAFCKDFFAGHIFFPAWNAAGGHPGKGSAFLSECCVFSCRERGM